MHDFAIDFEQHVAIDFDDLLLSILRILVAIDFASRRLIFRTCLKNIEKVLRDRFFSISCPLGNAEGRTLKLENHKP